MHFKTGSMFINIVSRSLLRLSTRGLSDKCSVRSWSSSSEILPNNMPNYKTLAVSVPKPYVYHIELNRPDKLNALSHNMWLEIYDCFNLLDGNEDCRVVLLSARGRAFTAGLDFSSMMAVAQKLSDVEDVARRCKIVTERLVKYQEAVSALEKCSKPVITLIHGSCIGAGVNFITAADIRYCTEDAVFQLKEVAIGMAADVGALQRLPRVVGSSSIAYELCLTARKMPSSEAKECGLVSRVFKDQKRFYFSHVFRVRERAKIIVK